MSVGEKCSIYNAITNFSSEPFLISIGNNVTLTSGVRLITHDGGMRVLCNAGFVEKADKFGCINIGNNVFIGIDTIILPNVNIGDNVVVGACSVVTKDLPSNGVYAGSPAKFICTIEQYYEKNKNLIDYTRGLSPEEKKKILLQKYKK